MTMIPSDLMPEVLIRSTLLLALAWGLHAALAKCNPRWRIFLWRAVGCGLVLIPALMMLMPKYVMPIEMPMQLEPASAGTPIISAVTSIDQSNINVLEQIQLPVADQAVAPPPPPVFDVRELLLAGWTLITGVFLLLYARKYFALRGILATTTTAPAPMQRMLHRLTTDFECEMPLLLLSPVIPAPILIGIRRPAIIIPERIAEDLTESGLAGILAHELSHLGSRDLMWTRFLQILSTLLWFHPLVWRMRRAHDFTCELVCDRVASEFSGGADKYSRTLADVALAMAGQWKPNFGLAMARRPDILTRLDFLNQKLKALPLARGRKAAAIAFVMVLMGCITSVDLKPGQKPAPQADAAPAAASAGVPMVAMAVPAGVPVAAARGSVPSEGGTANEGAPMPAAVPAGVPMVAMRVADPSEGGTTNEGSPMASAAAGVPMVAMQRADEVSSEPPKAAMAMPAGVPMQHARNEVHRTDHIDEAAKAANDQRRIYVEITPFEVNETRAKEFSSDFRIPGSHSGPSHKTGNTTATTSRDRAMVNAVTPGLSKSFPKWNLPLLEAEGIINMMPTIRFTARNGVSANVARVVEGMDEAAVLKEFNRLLGDNYKPADSDVSLTQSVKISDFSMAQFGDRDDTSIMMSILPRVTQKDGKDAVLLDIRALVLSRPMPEKNGVVNPLHPPQLLKKSVVTDAIVLDGGGIMIGGWTGERHTPRETRVPVLGKLPIVGDKLFTKHMQERHRTTTMFMVRCKLD